jgi:hypothetical protein
VVLDLFRAYRWPGNVREMKHAIKEAVVMSQGDSLTLNDFPEDWRTPEGASSSPPSDPLLPRRSYKLVDPAIEREEIVRALVGANGSRAPARHCPLHLLCEDEALWDCHGEDKMSRRGERHSPTSSLKGVKIGRRSGVNFRRRLTSYRQ